MAVISETFMPATVSSLALPSSPEHGLLVLWDVDHTLVDNAGVSKETYAAAFEELTGVEPQVAARTGGRTDRMIMRAMFADQGLQMPRWAVVAGALERAGAARYEAMRVRGSVLPGVLAAVGRLGAVPGAVQSVLTGNIRPNAEMKLRAQGLVDGFDLDVGAYGADSEDRAELVTCAQRRASGRYGRRFDESNTVLIGDTPRDVDAGRRGGAHVVAVATGVHTVDQLTAAGASAVLQDLADLDALRRHLARLLRT